MDTPVTNPLNPISAARPGQVLLAACLLSGSILSVSAATFAEPESVIYGRIVQLCGGKPFLIEKGTVTWMIDNPLAPNKPFALSGIVKTRDTISFNYQIRVRHEALGFNLTPSGKALPLTGSGIPYLSSGITLDGEPVRVSPGVAFSLPGQQAKRAATFRVDLELVAPAVDSDSDGYPDWWEELHGYDKWDAASLPANLPPPTPPPSDAQITTFAAWRELYFPGQSGSLSEFASQDPDHDGLPNLIEYAFSLDPRVSDLADENLKLPRLQRAAGALALAFHKRPASDILYQIESSTDLSNWISATELFHPQESAPAGLAVLPQSADLTDLPHRFVRVRVQYNP
jgi:hypothetical protein